MNVIATQNLSKSVKINDDTLSILRQVSVNVKSGESVAIVGASGSGKSTLLGLLAGLDIPSAGEVFLNGHPLHAMDEEKRAALRAKDVGFIFQSFLLVPSLTALENVMLPAELNGDKEARNKALALLEQVGLAERVRHFPNQLSGGEQQRVAIARAFIENPKVLFADEPTGNLDTANGEKIADLLFQMNAEKGTTLVLVTHDLKLAERCHTVHKMAAGEIIESLTTQSAKQVKRVEEASACG